MLALLFMIVSGVDGTGPANAQVVRMASLWVSPFVLILVSWTWRILLIRNDGFVVSDTSISRFVKGQEVWKKELKEVVIRLERRFSPMVFLRGTTLGVYDRDQTRLGSIALSMVHSNRVGKQHRKALALMIESASEFVIPRPSLLDRQRGYLWRGSLLGVCGGLGLWACLMGLGRLLDDAAQGQWKWPLPLWSILGLFLALALIMLGLVELTHLVRDKDKLDETAETLARFVDQPVLERVEMVPGIWYRYRDAQEIQNNWAIQAKITTILLLVTIALTPISVAIRAKLGIEQTNFQVFQ